MQLHTHQCTWKPLHIIPVGDIQWAGRGHFSVSLSALRSHIQRGLNYLKAGDQVFWLGTGDMIDFTSPSNRARLNAADLHDTAVDILDATALSLNQELFDLALKPTADQPWAALEGHHYRQLTTGATSDMELCKLLGATFLGTSALIRFHFRSTRGAEISAVVFAHHGVGGGQTGYYPVMRLEKVAADWEGVDVFIMGHACKQAVELRNRIRPRWDVRSGPDLVHRKVMLVGAGGFSKTYAENARQGNVPRGGYAEKGMMTPTVLGAPIIHIVPGRRRAEGRDTHGLTITVEA